MVSVHRRKFAGSFLQNLILEPRERRNSELHLSRTALRFEVVTFRLRQAGRFPRWCILGMFLGVQADTLRQLNHQNAKASRREERNKKGNARHNRGWFPLHSLNWQVSDVAWLLENELRASHKCRASLDYVITTGRLFRKRLQSLWNWCSDSERLV
jgi:hypothetical protein